MIRDKSRKREKQPVKIPPSPPGAFQPFRAVQDPSGDALIERSEAPNISPGGFPEKDSSGNMPSSDERGRFQALFSSAPLGYIITDRSGMIADLNPEAERLFGSRGQLGSTSIFTLERTKEAKLKNLATLASLSMQKSLFTETVLAGRRGIRFPVGIHVIAAENSQNNGIDLHWMIRNLTLEKRVEDERRYQSRSREILSGISQKFIQAATTDSASLFQDALEQVGSFIDADRCSILLIGPDGSTISQVFEWCKNQKDRIEDYLVGTAIEGFPWLYPQLQNGEVVIARRVDQLPEEARSVRQYWKNIRVRRALVLPLREERDLLGALFIEHTRQKKIWAEASLPLLQTLAALFTGMVARIRNEEELRISEEKFRTIFENFLNPVFIAGDDGRFTDANVAALDFMEQGMEDVAEKRLTDWIPSLEKILPDMPVEKKLKPRIIETEYTTHGRTKTMLLNVVPFPVRGRILYYGIGQDITERKQAEREIADARNFAEGIIQAVTPSLVVITADGRIAFANQSFYQEFSLASDSIGQVPFWDIPGGGFNPPGLHDHINLLFASGKRIRRFEWSQSGPVDTERILELNAALISRRSPFGIMAVLVISDVTEQKRLEMAIRESEKRYQSLFENSPLSLWEEDFSRVRKFIAEIEASGIRDLLAHFTAHPDDLRKAVEMVQVIDVNQATLDLHGSGNKEAFMKGIRDVFTPASYGVFLEEFLAFAEGRLTFESEIRTTMKNGAERVLIIRLSLSEGSELTWDRVIVTLTDITDRKRAEEALRESKELYQYIASFTQENPAPILELKADGSLAFANVATTLALRRRKLPDDPSLFFPKDIRGILAELNGGGGGFFYREVALGESIFGESIYLSPENGTIRLYAQDITTVRKER